MLQPGEVRGVVLAGLGARTITAVLSRDYQVTEQLEFMVLQPMKDETWLRPWLAAHGFALAAEDLAREGERLYPVLRAVPGVEREKRQVHLEVGPRLLEEGHGLLELYLERLCRRQEKVVMGLSRAQPSPENWLRYRRAQNRWERLKEVYRCR